MRTVLLLAALWGSLCLLLLLRGWWQGRQVARRDAELHQLLRGRLIPPQAGRAVGPRQ